MCTVLNFDGNSSLLVGHFERIFSMAKLLVKAVPGFENLFASECGRIFRRQRATGRLVERNLNTMQTGYKTTHGKKIGKERSAPQLVHRLVALAWLGPQPKDKPIVCHKDDIKDNNHVSNLYWGTYKENERDKFANGRACKYGDNCAGASALTEALVKQLRREYILPGSSFASVSSKFGVVIPTAQFAITGKTWGHVSYLLAECQRIAANRVNVTSSTKRDRIKTYLKTTNLSMSEIARRTGVCRATVKKIKESQ